MSIPFLDKLLTDWLYFNNKRQTKDLQAVQRDAYRPNVCTFICFSIDNGGPKGWARLNKTLTRHKSVLVAFKQKTTTQRNAQQISSVSKIVCRFILFGINRAGTTGRQECSFIVSFPIEDEKKVERVNKIITFKRGSFHDKKNVRIIRQNGLLFLSLLLLLLLFLLVLSLLLKWILL